jgi:hypothetical protein
MDYLRLKAREAASLSFGLNSFRASHTNYLLGRWVDTLAPLFFLEWILKHIASKARRGHRNVDTALSAECLHGLSMEQGYDHPSLEITQLNLPSILKKVRLGLLKRKFIVHHLRKSRGLIHIRIAW